MIECKDIVVVIPIYKNDLDSIEIISLQQVFSVLSRYDIRLITPKSFVLVNEEFTNLNYVIEKFDDRYFKDTYSYSELCLSTEFYERFNNYAYMLIYQLDAFVFADRLIEFCRKNYDYWGAPTPSVYWPHSKTHIGNGGLSLRKIVSMIDITQRKYQIEQYMDELLCMNVKNEILSTEDRFLTYMLENDKQYRLPSIEEAFEFSIEYNINGIYKDIDDHIPFGTHRWNKYNFHTWWRIISKYRYRLDEESINKCEENGITENINYYRKIIVSMHKQNSEILNRTLKNVLGERDISIWGGGMYSTSVKKSLEELGITISTVYDKNSKEYLYPDKNTIIKDQKKIIIASLKYKKEIEEELIEIGKVRNKDFFSLSELILLIAKELCIDENGETI